MAKISEEDLVKARRRIALQIAEQLELKWRHLPGAGYDIDEARQLIEGFIPHTTAEAQAEWDSEGSNDETFSKTSVLRQLRAAVLNIPIDDLERKPKTPIFEVIVEAIKIISTFNLRERTHVGLEKL